MSEASKTRIYRVTNVATKDVRLIRGINRGAVRSFAARGLFNIDVATQNELVSFIASGTKVEESTGTSEEQGELAVEDRPY